MPKSYPSDAYKRGNGRKGKGIPIPPENLSWDESKAGELININDWEEEEE
jgi:hypothetical protein